VVVENGEFTESTRAERGEVSVHQSNGT
jgi:hypothetical protein